LCDTAKEEDEKGMDGRELRQEGGREGGREGGKPTLAISNLVRRNSPSTGRMTGQTGRWVVESMRVSCGGG